MKRNEFIKLSALGMVSTLIPNFIFSKTFFSSDNSNNEIEALLKQAADFRKAGLENKARNAYNSILKKYPLEIRAYDGLRKTILARGKKEEEVIKLFQQALKKYPDSVQLKERLYRELMNISCGNKKIKKLYEKNGRLLEQVKIEYQSMSETDPNNKNLKKKLEKINRKLSWNADTENPRKNSAMKQFKKEQHKQYKNRFDDLNNDEVSEKLQRLLSKPASKDRKKHIRELYNLSIKKFRKEKNYRAALEKSLDYFRWDKTDVFALKQVRELAKTTKNYDILVETEIENHALKNTFWSAVALFDALAKKSEKNNTVLPASAEKLLTFMNEKAEDGAQDFEVETRQMKLNLFRGNTAEAREILVELLKSKSGIKNPVIIDRVNVLAAKYFHKTGEVSKANQILFIAMNPKSFENESDEILQLVFRMNENRSFEKPVHLQTLQSILSNLN